MEGQQVVSASVVDTPYDKFSIWGSPGEEPTEFALDNTMEMKAGSIPSTTTVETVHFETTSDTYPTSDFRTKFMGQVVDR